MFLKLTQTHTSDRIQLGDGIISGGRGLSPWGYLCTVHSEWKESYPLLIKPQFGLLMSVHVLGAQYCVQNATHSLR